MTDDSPAAQPGYGRSPEEGEPTTRVVHRGDVVQPSGATPVDAPTAGLPRQLAGPEVGGQDPDATIQQAPVPAADHAGQASRQAHDEGQGHGYAQARDHAGGHSHGTGHDQSAAQGHDQSAAQGHDQSAAQGHDQSAAQGHDQSAAQGHDQSAAQGHDQSAAQGHDQSAAQGHHQSAAQGHDQSAAQGHDEGQRYGKGPTPHQPTGPATPYDDPQTRYAYGDPTPHYGPFHGGGAPQPEQPWTAGPDVAATSGAPSSGAPAPSYPWEGDRYGFDLAPARGPRIEPSPPPNRKKLVLGLLIGLAAGLLIFGTGGVIAGRATAPTAKPVPTAAPTTEPPLGLYEQSQSALNQPKFTDALTPIGQGWLPYLAGCSRSGTTNGPVLNVGEKTRVRCTFDGMTAVFVEYTSVAARDKARVATLGQNVDARTLTPGVGAATERATPSGRTSGNYVEYAYKLTENNVTRTVSGIWWDDARTPVAAYLLAYWKDGVGESWAPMRDIWTRYA